MDIIDQLQTLVEKAEAINKASSCFYDHWALVVYMLDKNYKRSEVETIGQVMVLTLCKNQTQAERLAEELVRQSGFPRIFAVPLCQLLPISAVKTNGKQVKVNIKAPPIQLNGRLEEDTELITELCRDAAQINWKQLELNEKLMSISTTTLEKGMVAARGQSLERDIQLDLLSEAIKNLQH